MEVLVVLIMMNMEITKNKYYNYILLDPRKPYKW